MNELPSAPRKGKILMLKADTYEALREAAQSQLVPNEEDFVVQSRNGKKMISLRVKHSEVAAAAITPVCPFGTRVTYNGVPSLSGGFVFGGSTNLEITPIPLNLSSNTGDWLYLAVDFGANTVDGILLPGVDSITGHTISHGSLPSNTIPTMSSTSGKIHIPLGFYTSSTTPGGGSTFTPTGCGNITIQHCPGNISFTRA